MTYRPPTITETGTEKWINDNTPIGYTEFIRLVELGVKPAAIARACKKDSRTVRSWLDYIARDKGYNSWRELYER
jgi:hypothetical protein